MTPSHTLVLLHHGEMISQAAFFTSTKTITEQKASTFAWSRGRPQTVKEEVKYFMKSSFWLHLNTTGLTSILCLHLAPCTLPPLLYTVREEMAHTQTPISCRTSISLSLLCGAWRKETDVSFLIGSDWQEACISLEEPSTHISMHTYCTCSHCEPFPPWDSQLKET